MIYSIGHSTRSIEGFLALLAAHGIAQLADIRSIPRSRRHPHFSSAPLAASLQASAVSYRHFSALGGLRKARRDSTNTAWRHAGFRGYADYMETAPFQSALDDLLKWSQTGKTVIMCAEALWWQCHRQLAADALVARGVPVRHIMSAAEAPPHVATSFARLEDGQVRYPGLV